MKHNKVPAADKPAPQAEVLSSEATQCLGELASGEHAPTYIGDPDRHAQDQAALAELALKHPHLTQWPGETRAA